LPYADPERRATFRYPIAEEVVVDPHVVVDEDEYFGRSRERIRALKISGNPRVFSKAMRGTSRVS
jgi:hypothetical protein